MSSRHAARLLYVAASQAARSISTGSSKTGPPAFKKAEQVHQYYRDSRGYEHFRKRQGISLPSGNRRFLLLVGGGLCAFYYYTHLEEVPYTHRKHFVLISPKYERALGEATFQQVKKQAEETGTLFPENHPAVVQVRQIGSRIAEVASKPPPGGGYMEHMKNLKWEFAVIASPQAKAFVVPGGKVVVFTGLLQLLEQDKELAAVLAHEVAHVVARHVGEKISKQAVVSFINIFAYYTLGIPIPYELTTLTVELPNSRKLETEADAIGLQLASRACYDPSAAAIVFEKLGQYEKELGGDRIPEFLRTHPLSQTRIQVIKRQLPAALELYMESGCTLRFQSVRNLFRGGAAAAARPPPQPEPEVVDDGWF